MFSATFQAGPWQTNTHLVGAHGREVVVIDPGVDAAAHVERIVAADGLEPAAIVLTHGHLDHVASAAGLAARYGVPVHVHPADRPLLTDPARGLGPGFAPLIRQVLGGVGLEEPADLREVGDQDVLAVAGLDLRIVHAPGHTPGSVLIVDDEHARAFVGDVVFAGSIGRTDLPGGDMDEMRATLRTRVVALADALSVLPGHGPATTMARERGTNPYLSSAFLGDPA